MLEVKNPPSLFDLLFSGCQVPFSTLPRLCPPTSALQPLPSPSPSPSPEALRPPHPWFDTSGQFEHFGRGGNEACVGTHHCPDQPTVHPLLVSHKEINQISGAVNTDRSPSNLLVASTAVVSGLPPAELRENNIKADTL